MVVPKFRISQNSRRVYMEIETPFLKSSEMEACAVGKEFFFSAPPYFLRLKFSHKFIEDPDKCCMSYENNRSTLSVQCIKKKQQQHFETVELISYTLNPENDPVLQTQFAVSLVPGDFQEIDFMKKVENLEKCPEQKEFGVGFNDARTELYRTLQDEIDPLIEIKNPESKSPKERRSERTINEVKSFDPDHYAKDLYDAEEIEALLDTTIKIADIERKEAKTLKFLSLKKVIVVEESQKQRHLCALVDIIFGYVYDLIVTSSEGTVESSWNVSKLSSTLSWFDQFTDVREAVIHCMRRSLIKPLFRNFKLSLKVVDSMVDIFYRGKPMVLNSLLHIRNILRRAYDNRFVLSNLFIDDYIVWVQTLDDECLVDVSKQLDQLEISKSDLDLNLNSWENLFISVLNDDLSSSEESEVDSSYVEDSDEPEPEKSSDPQGSTKVESEYSDTDDDLAESVAWIVL